MVTAITEHSDEIELATWRQASNAQDLLKTTDRSGDRDQQIRRDRTELERYFYRKGRRIKCVNFWLSSNTNIRKVVLKWSFLVSTLLLPFIMACFAVVPAIIFSLKGEPTRIIVVDPSGKIAPRLKANLSAEKIAEKAEKAMQSSMKDVNASQEEKMQNGIQQFSHPVHDFVDFDSRPEIARTDPEELSRKDRGGEIDAYL